MLACYARRGSDGSSSSRGLRRLVELLTPPRAFIPKSPSAFPSLVHPCPDRWRRWWWWFCLCFLFLPPVHLSNKRGNEWIYPFGPSGRLKLECCLLICLPDPFFSAWHYILQFILLMEGFEFNDWFSEVEKNATNWRAGKWGGGGDGIPAARKISTRWITAMHPIDGE